MHSTFIVLLALLCTGSIFFFFLDTLCVYCSSPEISVTLGFCKHTPEDCPAGKH